MFVMFSQKTQSLFGISGDLPSAKNRNGLGTVQLPGQNVFSATYASPCSVSAGFPDDIVGIAYRLFGWNPPQATCAKLPASSSEKDHSMLLKDILAMFGAGYRGVIPRRAGLLRGFS
jgi:hypothetical protein